ncbi:MAG TPA: hypothetical protein EYG85_08340 [Crocinitomix sp.]|nr:hypothetical protein [Crocinitomix sp.]
MMKDDKNILNKFKKRKTPKVPQAFFDSFVDTITSELKNNTSIINQIIKRKQPKVSAEFFDNFADNITIKPVRKRKVISLKIFIISSVAASLLLFIILNLNSNNQMIAQQKLNPQIEFSNSSLAEYNDEYLATLFEEDDLVEFIIDNQIGIEQIPDENDELFNQIESELDDFMYEF